MWGSVSLRDRFRGEVPDVVEISMEGGVTRYKVEDNVEEEVGLQRNRKKRKWMEKND